jgi:hypothetical protein
MTLKKKDHLNFETVFNFILNSSLVKKLQASIRIILISPI